MRGGQVPTLTQLFKPDYATKLQTFETTGATRAATNLMHVEYEDDLIGGCGPGLFKLYQPFETILNMQAGNVLRFAAGGGYLVGSIVAGSNTLVVDDASDFLPPGCAYSLSASAWGTAAQVCLIDDGVNSEVVTVTAKSGFTLTLALGTTYAYAAGVTIAILRYTGIIAQRQRTINLSGDFELTTTGLWNRLSDPLLDYTIANQECGSAIVGILGMAGQTVTELFMPASGGFPNTGVNFTGTGQAESAQSIILKILQVANGNSSNLTYTVYVDPQRFVRMVSIPTTTPNVTIALAQGLPAANVAADYLADLVITDQDITNVFNVLRIEGGKKADGTALAIIVRDTVSIGLYGQKEQVTSQPSLIDETTAVAWGVAALRTMAYPASAGTGTFDIASLNVSARDLVNVTGFDDASSYQFNPVAIVTTVDAQAGASQALTTSQILPNLNQLMAEIANEKVIKKARGASNTPGNYMLTQGCTLSNSGLAISISPGFVTVAGVRYAVPAFGPLTMANNQTRFFWFQTASGTVRALAHPVPDQPTDGFYPDQGLLLGYASVLDNVVSLYQTPTTGIGTQSFVDLPNGLVFPGISSILVTLTAEGTVSASAAVQINLVPGLTTAGTSASTPVWLSEYLVTYAASVPGGTPLGSNDKWEPPKTAQTSQFTNTLLATINTLDAGQSYDLGMQIRSPYGSLLPPTPALLTAAQPSISANQIAISIGTSQFAKMPAAIKAAGPTVSTSALGAMVGQGGGVHAMHWTATIADWALNAQPGWYAGIHFYIRLHGDTVSKAHYSGYIAASGAVNLSSIAAGLGANNSYDIGLCYYSTSHETSAIVWPAGLGTGTADPVTGKPPAVATSGRINLIRDSNMDHIGTSGATRTMAYWQSSAPMTQAVYPYSTPSFQPYGPLANESGSEYGLMFFNSMNASIFSGSPIYVTPGTLMTIFAFISATGCSGAAPFIGVYAAGGTAKVPTVGALIAQASQPAGSSGHVSTTFTIPSNVTSVVVVLSSNGSSFPTPASLYMNAPMLHVGAGPIGYTPGLLAQSDGTIAHPAHSAAVQAQIQPTPNADGFYIVPGSISRIAHVGTTGPGENVVFNPTAAANTLGWSTSFSSGLVASFSRDALLGGRHLIYITTGTASGAATYYQTITGLLANTSYAVSGHCSVGAYGGVLTLGAYVQILDGGGTVLAQSTANTLVSNGQLYFTFPFITLSTTIQVRLVAANGVGIAAFTKLMIHQGTVSHPYHDHLSNALVTATHTATAGADGSNIAPAQISTRHLVGSTPTDTSPMVDTSGKVLHAKHSTPVTAHLQPTANADGTYHVPGSIGRVAHVGPTGAGENFVYNPTGAKTNGGWTQIFTAGLAATFTRDGYSGGRLIIYNNGGLAGANDAYYQQVLDASASGGLFSGYLYTVSGHIEAEVYGSNAPGVCLVDVFDSAGTTLGVSPSIAIGTGALYFSFSFVANANVAYLRLRTGGGAVAGYFYKLQVNTGPVALAWGDHTSSGLTTTTHDAASAADGSRLKAGLVSARHLVGGNAADTGAMVDGNSQVLHARHSPAVLSRVNSAGGMDVSAAPGAVYNQLPHANHSPAVVSRINTAGGMDVSAAPGAVYNQLPHPNHSSLVVNRNAAHWSCAGRMPYMSGSTLVVPAAIICFRPDGTFTRWGPGTVAGITAWSAIVGSWNAGGTGSVGGVTYSSPQYNFYLTTTTYEVIGYINADSGALVFHAPWVNADHVSNVQTAIDTVGNVQGIGAARHSNGTIPAANGTGATLNVSLTLGASGTWYISARFEMPLTSGSGYIAVGGVVAGTVTNYKTSSNVQNTLGMTVGAATMYASGGQTITLAVQASSATNAQFGIGTWTLHAARMS